MTVGLFVISAISNMVFSKDDKAVIATLYQEKGWRGRIIFQEFPNKYWIQSSVDRLINKLINTGSTERSIGGGRPRTSRTEENIAEVADVIQSQEDQPGTHLSQRKTAQKLKISRIVVRNIIEKDLKLKPFKRIKTSRKTENVKVKRKTRSRKLLDKYSQTDVKRIVFTDEKDFTLEIPLNSKNDVVYGRKKSEIPISRLYHEENRFSKKVMVSAGVSWNGKTRIHFIDTKTSKVNAERYLDLIKDKLLPDCRVLHPDRNFIFQQDGATSHTAKITQTFLSKKKINFIKKDEWPPESPDLNPMDYAIWPALRDLVYFERTTPFTENELKQKIAESWNKLTIKAIRKSISSWKKRLRAVGQADGNATEHLRL